MNGSWTRREGEHPARDPHRKISDGVVISRTCALSPEWAELALSAALGQAASSSFVALVGGSLHLQSRTVADDPYGLCRRLTGSMVSKRGWFLMPVELELSEWSASASGLTLRPLAGGRRPGWARWYLRVGSAVMDLLVAAIDDPVCLPDPCADGSQPNFLLEIEEIQKHQKGRDAQRRNRVGGF